MRTFALLRPKRWNKPFLSQCTMFNTFVSHGDIPNIWFS